MACLEAAHKKRRDVDDLLGTNGMAGHYFGKSQWAFPTRPAFDKMRTIMPALDSYEAVLKRFGVNATGYYKIYGLTNKTPME